MTYIPPTTRTYAYKVGAAADWNILVNDIKDHEARILALEASGGVTLPTNLPVGGIIMWSGAIGSIPADFVLCDGTNSTPDLRDMFVIGAGSTYAVGATGGATTHKHSGGGSSSDGSHNHSGSGNTGGPSGTTSVRVDGATTSVGSSSHTHSFSFSTGSAGSHSHSVGDTGYASSMPPYYALAFIMRSA